MYNSPPPLPYFYSPVPGLAHHIKFFTFVTTLRILQFAIKVKCYVGQLLFNVPYDLHLGCCRKRVTSLCKDPRHVPGEVPSCEVHSLGGVRKPVALVYWDCVAYSITAVKNCTCNKRRKCCLLLASVSEAIHYSLQ